MTSVVNAERVREFDAGVVAELIAALAAELAAAGDLSASEWEQALYAAPRHLFVPDRAWCVPDGGGAAYGIDRGVDAGAWLAAAYRDAAIITQIDDGRGDPATGRGLWTSSLSAPGAVAAFLELLAPRRHDRVLEIGTGTGWTAALLSARLGDRGVTSVEVDELVAKQAAVNLAAAGFAPDLVVGDGAAGVPGAGPFDRVHVTCAVTTIPYTWVQQTRPGGVIVLPWAPEFGDGHKVRLTVTGDGRAIGAFHGGASYMMLRAQRGGGLTIPDEGGRESRTRLDPRSITGDSYGADVAIAALVPDVLGADRTTADGRHTLVLADTAATSWARCEHQPGATTFPVLQAGPRNLFDEITHAYLTWIGWGSPGRSRFGLTVEPGGQYVWRDHPDNLVTPATQR